MEGAQIVEEGAFIFAFLLAYGHRGARDVASVFLILHLFLSGGEQNLR
jgi:hypothetical protein